MYNSASAITLSGVPDASSTVLAVSIPTPINTIPRTAPKVRIVCNIPLIFSLLFCPIRYRGKIKKDRTDSLREIHAFGEVSWLLHIISAQVFWEQGVLKTKLCFLGIPLEKLKNLFKLLQTEMVKRKEILAQSGVSSFVAYKEAGYRDLPQIVVVIDNLTALKEMYLQDQDYLLPLCRDGIAVGISFVVANVQTSGIGYRYLNNFEGRIALFCNETSEYGMLFEGCRMKLPNIPGRCLIQLNKHTYESQMYLSFEGEKEFERVQKIQDFVKKQNEKYTGMKAAIIPEIPKELTLSYIQKTYPDYLEEGKVMLGLDYNTVSPMMLEIAQGGMFTISGKKEKGKDIFVKYLLEAMLLPAFGGTDLYILDDMTRRWADYEFHPDTAVYDNTTGSIRTIFDEVDQRVQSRYEDFAQRQEAALDDENWIVVVIESSDAIAEISADKKIIGTIKGMLGKYRMMKVLILMTNVENAAIPFSAPDLMKIVKDNRRYIIFDDISNIKLCDLSVSIAKKYAKPIEFCDAFYVNENELTKIKTVKLS